MTNTTKQTAPAPATLLVLVDRTGEHVLAADEDVESFLNAGRKGPDGCCPGPVMTKKYQANMPRSYQAMMAKVAKKHGLASEAACVRFLVEQGLQACGFEVEGDDGEE